MHPGQLRYYGLAVETATVQEVVWLPVPDAVVVGRVVAWLPVPDAVVAGRVVAWLPVPDAVGRKMVWWIELVAV